MDPLNSSSKALRAAQSTHACTGCGGRTCAGWGASGCSTAGHGAAGGAGCLAPRGAREVCPVPKGWNWRACRLLQGSLLEADSQWMLCFPLIQPLPATWVCCCMTTAPALHAGCARQHGADIWVPAGSCRPRRARRVSCGRCALPACSRCRGRALCVHAGTTTQEAASSSGT